MIKLYLRYSFTCYVKIVTLHRATFFLTAVIILTALEINFYANSKKHSFVSVLISGNCYFKLRKNIVWLVAQRGHLLKTFHRRGYRPKPSPIFSIYKVLIRVRSGSLSKLTLFFLVNVLYVHCNLNFSHDPGVCIFYIASEAIRKVCTQFSDCSPFPLVRNFYDVILYYYISVRTSSVPPPLCVRTL